MRAIDANELIRKIDPIIEAENQIYRRESWGFAVKCRDAIEEMPTIEPQQWIPITERLPGAYNIVLVTLINGDVTIGRYDADTYQWSVYSGNWWNARGNDILAWMPLPTQYIVDE